MDLRNSIVAVSETGTTDILQQMQRPRFRRIELYIRESGSKYVRDYWTKFCTNILKTRYNLVIVGVDFEKIYF